VGETPSRRSTWDPDRREWAELLADQPPYRVDQVVAGLHRQLDDVADISNLPASLRHRIAEDLPPALHPVAESVTDGGDTVKFLWERHLGTGEIVEQVVRASRRAREHPDGPRRVGNVVFMGMGEPLANLDHTWAAVQRLHDEVGIGARHLTISTVGLIPGIRRLAEAELPVNLAVSLHAADNTLRDELVPVNRRYPLEDLVEACHRYVEATRRRVSFEWALISGVNDRFVDADRLVPIATGLRAHVNLIPLNPTPGFAVRGSSRNRVHAFRDRLAGAGVNVTIRDTRGSDIDAACGQLRAGYEATPVARPRRSR